ncbi:Di-and tricarboxylate transporters [Aquiflexum balticum DSM 16537]|uniref:Di-and tricarboxylate transporters n=1 Tax=Aquiflexum balticum DSM 16537 TaxID=758820 RepID=A0A1W2H8T5_9BACT|nr:SLC13 family permease [Aquiflexum balticum]SMD45088.1 Di-and tricarboxylate transporters [Aquiflexum balticum DSM 16537]
MEMDPQILIVLGILIATVIMMVFELFRIDVVAIICMLALGWSGVLTTDEMLVGFSSNAVISMIAVMILGYGITTTGVMEKFSEAILSKVGHNKNKIIGFLSISVGTLSAFMQNIGAAALFLPGTLEISRKTKIPVSQLIMPIGFAAILGGSLTMVGSGHLILINDLLKNADLEPYGLFAVTPIGAVLLIAGVLYFFILGSSVLPKESNLETKKSGQEKLMDTLSLSKKIWYLSIQKNSPLIGLTAESSGIWKKLKLNIIALSKGEDIVYAPWRETAFQEGQILAILGREEDVKATIQEFGLSEISAPSIFNRLDKPEESGFAEIIFPASSEMIGKSIRDFGFRRRFGLEPLILFSKRAEIKGDFSDHIFDLGDTLIVYGLWDNIRALKETSDLIVATPIESEPKNKQKTIPAVASFTFAIMLTFLGVPIALAFMTGAMAMILSRVISIQQAYKVIDWKVVFLLAGLIPLGVAMQKSGAAYFLAENMMQLIKGQSVLVLVIAITLLATTFSLFMSNIGAVVVLAPLVIGMAEIAGLDPRPLVLLAAISVSNSFVLPTHQVNALMMSSGGYKNRDYIKAGSGMTLLFIVLTVAFFYTFYL